MDVAGHKGWMETQFHAGKNLDGTVRTQRGFKNVLTDQEVIGDRPPSPTGDMPCVRHSGDAFRSGYDQIQWER
jgi:hypothetical protein